MSALLKYPLPGTAPLPPRHLLPSMYDLPSEDPQEPGLADEFHYYQPHLLSETFYPPDWARDQVFAVGDMNLYFDLQHTLWHKRPDWFAVLGVPNLYEHKDLRLSYVLWQEGVVPSVVVELLSPSTAKEDLGQSPVRDASEPPSKWQVYESILRIPYYVLYDHYQEKLQIFQHDGKRYQSLPKTGTEQRIWLPEINLGLGVWQGEYRDTINCTTWVRWLDAQGAWLLTPFERERARVAQVKQAADVAQQHAEQEKQRAEQEKQRADLATQEANQEKQRADFAAKRATQAEDKAAKLAAKLRELGIDPGAL